MKISPLLHTTILFAAFWLILGMIGWRANSIAMLGWSILFMYLTVVLFNIWLMITLWQAMGKTNGFVKILVLIIGGLAISAPEIIGMLWYTLAVSAKTLDNAASNVN